MKKAEKKIKKKPLWYWIVVVFYGLGVLWNSIQAILHISDGALADGIGSLMGGLITYFIICYGLNWWISREK